MKEVKKGQITVFVIVAIVLVAAVTAYFLFRQNIVAVSFPQEFEPVESYLVGCVSDIAKDGLSLAGLQAGYIYPPEFEKGSEYSPLSSQLDFFGFSVPYWYYVSGNGIVKEQLPAKNEIENQVEQFVESRIEDCNFQEFQNYDIGFDFRSVDVSINELSVDVNLNALLSVESEESKGVLGSHQMTVNSKIGKFYDLSREIYNKEQNDLFLERYAEDVLRLYAPVDGVEISCSPRIWVADSVVSDLYQALEANMQAIKLKGDYYQLAQEENKYFIQDIESDELVNFIYDSDWPSRIEIWPSENNILMAEPIGLEEGLGILGFCYVPYHFVYDIHIPVLIQVYDLEETFQFPVAVVIDKNLPRESAFSLYDEDIQFNEPELCKFANTEIEIVSYNNFLDPVEADISFRCLDAECSIGRTSLVNDEASLIGLVPQCVNGLFVAVADGYKTAKEIVSTNEDNFVGILLEKKYEKEIELKLNGLETNLPATIQFISDTDSATIIYPQQKQVSLAQDDYEVSVQIYRNTTLTFPSRTIRNCVDVPRQGILGFFGGKEEQCYDYESPQQIVSFALAGGGKGDWFATESELADSSKIVIDADNLPFPNSLEQIQENYNIFDSNKVFVRIDEENNGIK